MSTRYNTGNPIESTDVRDMSDNAKNFDEFSNSASDTFTDRFGVQRKTIEGVIREIGIPIIGNFTTGCIVTDSNQGVQEVGGSVYRWKGALPKIVPPSSTPSGTGGISPSGDWVDVGDASLRHDLGDFVSYGSTFDIAGGYYPVGRTVSVLDRDRALFEIVAGGTPNGFDVLDAGDGNTAELVDRYNISPESLGYTSGDCAPYFNALHTAGENGFNCILKPNKLYTALNSIAWSGKDTHIVGNHSSLSFSGGYFLQEGSLADSSVTIATTASKGGDTVTLSTSSHGLNPGDVVIIWNPVAFSFCGRRDYYRDGEFNTVLSVSGASIRLTDPLRSTYPSSDLVKVMKMAPVRITAENFTVIGNTTTADAWRIRLAIGSRLESCSAYSGRDNSLRLDRCYKFDAYGGVFECKTPADFLQYGVFVGNSQMVNFHKPRMHGTRHALATGGQADLGSVPNRDVFVREANASSDLFWSLDMHGNIENGQFIECITNRGVGLAGVDAAVIGGTHSRSDESPIQFGEVVGGTYRIKDLSLNVGTLAAIRANNSDLLYDVRAKNIHFEIERVRIAGSGAFETLALISYGWKSGTDWTVTVRDITFTGTQPAAVIRLNKLTRPDAGNVPQPLSVVVQDVANVPATSKWCELLGVAWVQGITRFTLPAQSIKVSASISTGQFVGAETGFSYTAYPTTPNISARYSGIAFSGNSAVFVAAKSVGVSSGVAFMHTASTTLTAGANSSGAVDITVSMERMVF